MAKFSLLASLFAVLAAYFTVSVRERNFVNVLTPLFAVFVPGNYFADIFVLWGFGPTASTYAYFLNYLAYAAFLCMTAAGYLLAVPALRLPLSSDGRPRGSRFTAYLLLSLALVLYGPVLLQFRADIFNPRAIYEQTRSGFGANFFLSTTLCYLALVLFLFHRTSKIETCLFVLVCLCFMWLHGSKGHMLGIVFILAMHSAYVMKRRVGIVGMGVVAGGLLAMMLGLFLITNPGILLDSGGAVMNLVGYSSYTANSMIVIDSNLGPLDGQLTLEQQFYGRMPRLLDPEKPHDFGEFYLGKRFFPAAYESDTGAPAFGFGTVFADFGAATPVILAFAGLLNGLIMKSFVNSLRRYPGPGEFILLLFAAGIPLVPIVNSFLVPETVALAIFANLIHRFRLLGGRNSGSLAAAAG
jgi:hypothetical protein